MSGDEFEEHATQGFAGGNFWKPSEGEKVIGKVVEITETQYKRKTYVLNTDKGKVNTPTHAALINLLERTGVQVGDTVMIKCLGFNKGKAYWGKQIMLYELAAKAPDGTWREFKAPAKEQQQGQPPQQPAAPAPPPAQQPATVQQPAQQPAPAAPQPAPEKPKRVVKPKEEKKEEPEPEPAKEEVKPAAAPAAPPAKADEMGKPSKEEEVKHFVTQLFKFFKDMKLEEFNRYINETRKFGLTPQQAIEMCKDMVGVDGKTFNIVIEGEKVVKVSKGK